MAVNVSFNIGLKDIGQVIKDNMETIKKSTCLNRRENECLMSLRANYNILVTELAELFILFIVTSLFKDLDLKFALVAILVVVYWVTDTFNTYTINVFKVIKKTDVIGTVIFFILSALSVISTAALESNTNILLANMPKFLAALGVSVIGALLFTLAALIREVRIEKHLKNCKIIRTNTIDLYFKDKHIKSIPTKEGFMVYNNSIITVHNSTGVETYPRYVLVPENITQENDHYITHIMMGDIKLSTTNIQKWI